jgi:hypothetical protein
VDGQQENIRIGSSYMVATLPGKCLKVLEFFPIFQGLGKSHRSRIEALRDGEGVSPLRGKFLIFFDLERCILVDYNGVEI